MAHLLWPSAILEIPLASKLLVLFGTCVILSFIYLSGLVIYNIYFHPLSAYPGPKLWAATRLPYIQALVGGRLPFACHQLHEKYGDVVRIAPDELSYIALNGWKDIYGHRNGYSQIPKDRAFYNSRGEVDSIITGNDKLHSKFRRILAHAFSEKALRDQEPLVKTYVDLLMKKLHEQSNNGNTALDMVARYNWATFDLIGDLSFGEPFGSLEACVYHPWISMIFNGIKAGVYIGAIGRIPGAMALVKTFMPKRFMAAIEAHRALTIAKVNKRLEQTTDRADFMTYITRQKDEAGMTAAEMYVNASIIIIAGSETTATVLSGTTYLLLRNPRVLKKLVDEIRGTFMNEDDINFATVNKLEYTIAVLNEAMRMYPAVPTGLPRRLDAEGRLINDRWVPGNTSLSMNQWSTYHSATHFRNPHSFVPERFLGDPQYASDNLEVLQPFSVGPRNCIGKNLALVEMRLILARVIWNFDMELESESENWSDQQIYTLWHKKPLLVKLTAVAR